ncbi:metallophosphoesterase family protein [Corynebacterium aquilae]|uniref:Nuclease SbcCD subunit D n=1 Tax=Corynebacterium aquilae DSM 44791 TaxID=1431546 RepID=A0A1L7CFC4_9CORY|nr:DNA repair exonuclease [Corynebacterium aquilae]APT84528.1 hypothetical protein CAQU_05060 [Corynebacterium aquilae DSM 44791]
MNVRFLHTSDWQIGATYWMLDADGQARLDQARLDAIRTMGTIAHDTNCAFMLVAGDIFDKNSLKKTTLNRALETIKSIPVPVYLLPGNHDPLTADSVFYQATQLDNVTVLDHTGPFTVTDHVELVAAPLLTRHTYEDPVARMLSTLDTPAPGTIRIACGHGAVDSHTSIAQPNTIDLATVTEALDNHLIDYLALGDTHSTRQLDEHNRIYYSGAPEVTDFHDFDGHPIGATTGSNETNSGNCLVVDITKDTTGPAAITVTPHTTGTWTFQAHTRDCNSQHDAEEFITFLKSFTDKPRTVIKYALIGTVDVATKQFLEHQLNELEPTFAALYPRTRLHHLTLNPSDDDLDNLNLNGYANQALKELIDNDETDALSLMFRLTQDQQ